MDAIFTTQEVIAKYMREESCVIMCLYDLQKAFDSVKYPVLLEKLDVRCWSERKDVETPEKLVHMQGDRTGSKLTEDYIMSYFLLKER